MVEICSRFFIAGVAYSDYQQDMGLKPGVKLDLFWEKSNKFDSNAIRVEHNGHKLGYIPRTSDDCVQELLHQYRMARIKVYPYLVSYNKTNPTYRMLTIKILAQKLLNDLRLEDRF